MNSTAEWAETVTVQLSSRFRAKLYADKLLEPETPEDLPRGNDADFERLRGWWKHFRSQL